VSVAPSRSGGSGSTSTAREVSAVATVLEKATEMRPVEEVVVAKAAEETMAVMVAMDKAVADKVAADKAAVDKVALEKSRGDEGNRGGHGEGNDGCGCSEDCRQGAAVVGTSTGSVGFESSSSPGLAWDPRGRLHWAVALLLPSRPLHMETLVCRATV
jgi:hypothetical protein